MTVSGTATPADDNSTAEIFDHIAVVGAGAWGTALALSAERAGRRVTLWARETEVVEGVSMRRRNPFLPDHPIPGSIKVTNELAETLAAADLVVLVVPSQFLRPTARQVESLLRAGVPVVICAKGIETGSGKLMTQVIAEEMPGRPQAVLSGPSFADEVAEGQPTAVTIASEDAGGSTEAAMRSLAARVALSFSSPVFRPYLSDDPLGVEVGGAVKNVLAIACGIAAGRGFGSNPRAALITRGLAEIKRLAEALGGRRETVTGLAGIGDLTLTCSSEQSRNFSFGKALGQGMTPEQALAGKKSVAEGAVNAQSVTELAARLGVDMPICQAVQAIIHEGVDIDTAIKSLLTRPIKAESRDLEMHISLPNPANMDDPDQVIPA
ncbi:MAG: NAD(P)-dependent glycerol-3-phosphate dehydrogenase [Alphaproteobacteria bacterium]|nr:NAD(P)-dependent glycerol-3-phosphate dehydrogenase [Alphaproteobacteria bacterium]MBU0798525.1 NAD(P)-dependent glycerol-3-phosphate dehydrogenase [Alphaproteobacteria bacterium]MBU0886195.1 NAD(P)-dependent glycerol-3-phosphate dehydrogenase [Alphaproteobacteria bacterium]MBU1812835.1 NAD(P)-dependent glycerol-3-phosphate dehydrogenase [Alphaproteobacteria bacterium]